MGLVGAPHESHYKELTAEMRESLITKPDQLHGLSATCIGSFWARAKYYQRAEFDIARLHTESAAYFDIEPTFETTFPGCDDIVEMGAFVSAREQILFERAVAALEDGSVNNILILASGISPLAVHLKRLINQRFSGRNVKVICTDLLDPIWLQKQLCSTLIKKYDTGINFDILDVLKKDDWHAVKDKLVDGGVAVICEGLLGYFKADDFSEVLTNIQDLLKERGGFFVTDIATRDGVRKTLFEGDSKVLLHRFYEVAEVNTDSLAFATRKECVRSINAHGLSVSPAALLKPEQMYIPRSVIGGRRDKIAKIVSTPMCLEVRVAV
jgi:O-methyltransferase involved in polyketide biosynthesis